MTRRRVSGGRLAAAVAWMVVIAVLLCLGGWQVKRRAWKLDLIAQVEARLKADPVPAPATAGPKDAYRRVFASGVFLRNHDSFVQASTVRGPGWWVLTPLREESGRIIIVNRGYVPARRAAVMPDTPTTVTGLLRISEPGGGFLRSNDPGNGRWYSRDVGAIAARQGLRPVAPYFIDADGTRNAPGMPVGGLTTIAFSNNHLVYAITWFMLAAMAAAGFAFWSEGFGRSEGG